MRLRRKPQTNETGAITTLMDAQFDQLRTRVAARVNDLGTILRGSDARLLFSEYERWGTSTSWQLINAADSCGT